MSDGGTFIVADRIEGGFELDFECQTVQVDDAPIIAALFMLVGNGVDSDEVYVLGRVCLNLGESGKLTGEVGDEGLRNLRIEIEGIP